MSDGQHREGNAPRFISVKEFVEKKRLEEERMSEEKLKSCPFCGKHCAKIEQQTYTTWWKLLFCRGGHYALTEEEVIALWNTRHTEEKSSSQNTELKAKLIKLEGMLRDSFETSETTEVNYPTFSKQLWKAYILAQEIRKSHD